MALALDDHRVDDRPRVVTGHDAFQPDRTGDGVDLHNGQVGAERIGAGPGLVGLGGQFLPGGRYVSPCAGHRGRADDVEGAAGPVENYVLYVCFEEVGGHLSGVVHDLPGRHVYRGAGQLRRAGSEGSGPLGHQVGVSLDELDVLDVHTQAVRGDHREGRHMPLTVRKGPWPDPGPTFRGDLHPGVLVATWCRTGGHFDVAGDPDSQLGDLSVLATSSLLGSQVVVAGRPEGQVEAGFVVAAVVLGPH